MIGCPTADTSALEKQIDEMVYDLTALPTGRQAHTGRDCDCGGEE